MNIYVGNLAYQLSETDLRESFEKFGEVTSVRIITDRETGKAKGFGFVEMTSDDEGEKAIEELNGQELAGRNLIVNKARPKPQGGGSGGGGGRRFGSGGGGGGGRRGF